MASLASKMFMLSVVLCVYVCGIKGRPNSNLDDETVMKDQQNFAETDLFKRSKTKGGGEDKGHSEVKGKKKQVIDAYHLGPYHRGHSWGTVSQWPGYHWGGHVGYHGGWTGYPSLGGWHKSHISHRNSKKSFSKALKRQALPAFGLPTYGFAYPSLALAAVPLTPSPLLWGYGVYRSKVPKKPASPEPRSSVKDSETSKRWWPGYMGGWGGWGIGNTGYPGWGSVEDLWGHGFDAAGLGLGWGFGYGDAVHPFLRSEVPTEQSKTDKAEKRWWPGYMGGWGGWGLGNTGYPGWGPLGADLAYGSSPYAYGHGVWPYGYGHGLGFYGFGRRLGLGYPPALSYRAGVPEKTKGKEEKEQEDEDSPKRQLIHERYAGFGYPLSGWGAEYSYGPYGTFGSPFIGHGAYIPYPEAIYGDFWPYYGFAPNGFIKSNIPSKKSKKVSKKDKNEEKATSRHFVANFHPGRYGWGGALYPGHGYHRVFPLLGALTYSGLYGGYYGPRGPPRGTFGLHYRSYVPDITEESGQNRQVINYHPGCCGWGGCVYPGCGYIGSWVWPLPCHFRRCHHHCAPCWTRSKYPRKEGVKEEKGKSRQAIESPTQEESDESTESKDPKTSPHLEGADLLNSEMKNLAMGFPGVEHLQTPVGDLESTTSQDYTSEGRESSNENLPSEAPQAESSETTAGFGGLIPDEGDNGFRIASAEHLMEQQGGRESSAGELSASFNFHPSQGELPSEAFGDTGNPNMYSEGQTTGSASRRADIPIQEDEAVFKKQAVAYPYGSLYSGYMNMMAHPVNPLYHYAPINYAPLQTAQHMLAYPSVVAPQPLPAESSSPSHSIHVGTPRVNVEVHTTRHRIAHHNPEKQKGSKLKHLMEEFSLKKLKKFGGKKIQWSQGKVKEKRQIPSAVSSPFMNRPMGFSPSQFRYPVPSTAGFVGQSMLSQAQPFNMNAMGRSGFPAAEFEPIGMGRSRFSPAGMVTPGFNPSQMAFSRQLSSITGISVPISAQPGMGIVGMASRKKRSTPIKPSKKQKKSTKRQFLASLPSQGFQRSSLSPLALPTAPFMGVGLPFLPSFPAPQPEIRSQQIRPMAFRSRAAPPVASKITAQRRLPAMRMASLSNQPIPAMAPLGGFPPIATNPFLGAPQPPNVNFFSGAAAAGPWVPFADGGQMRSFGAFNEGIRDGFPRRFEDNQEQLVQDMRQGAGQPYQVTGGEQVASFRNPSGLNFIEQQPTPMFSEGGRGNEAAGPFTTAPQGEMASFFSQLPSEGGLIESNNFNLPSGLGAMKKSSLPETKKHNKRKGIKSGKA